MSEYQYYEFQAIDRPLSRDEMQTLRGHSSRARITSTSFVNEYSFGSFKGDMDDWMAKYFDAFVHVANWGTRILMLRLPTRLLAEEQARAYARGRGKYNDALTIVTRGQSLVIRFCSHEDERWDDSVRGEGCLGSLAPIRSELAHGDLRALYLAWLRGMQRAEAVAEREPPVPPGLKSLSPALIDFVEFLEIDPDLVAAAAEASPELEMSEPNRKALERWVTELPDTEKDDLLIRLLEGNESHLCIELRTRFARERAARDPEPTAPPRSIGDLLAMAKRRRTAREQADARRAAEERDRRDREATLAREKHLEALATRKPQAWEKVEELISARQAKTYDEAARLLADLREIATRQNMDSQFARQLARIREMHAKKRSLIEQLFAKGL